MTVGEPTSFDIFQSPNEPKREYVVPEPGGAYPAGGADHVVILTSDGAEIYTAEEIEIDQAKLKPRLDRETSAQILRSAFFNFKLNEVNDGGYDA